MSTGKQTPAPKVSSEKKSPAEEAIEKTGKKPSSDKDTYPNPSQKN
jgi:hypothetical protein